MATITYSQDDVDAIAKAISEAPKAKVSLGDFCKLWNQVKPILEALQPIVALIPVVGAILSAAISTLLLAGNGAYKAICK